MEKTTRIKEFGSQILVTPRLLNEQTDSIRQTVLRQLLHAGAQWLVANGATAINTEMNGEASPDISMRSLVEFNLYGESVAEVTLAAVLTMQAEERKELSRRLEGYIAKMDRHDLIMKDQLRKVFQANQRSLVETLWRKLRGRPVVAFYEDVE